MPAVADSDDLQNMIVAPVGVATDDGSERFSTTSTATSRSSWETVVTAPGTAGPTSKAEVLQYAARFTDHDEICPLVDRQALAVRNAEGFEETDSFWLTYNGANLAALMRIEWAAGELGVPVSSTPVVRQALLTQPLFIHHLDSEGPFHREGAAEAQVVASVIKVYTKNPAGFLWYRLTGVLRARDFRQKSLATRIITELLQVGRTTKLWQLGYHSIRAKIEGEGLFGLKRSFMRVVTIALLRHRLQGVGSKVSMVLSDDLINMLQSDDASGKAAAEVLRTLISQAPSCQSLIMSGALIKLNYLSRFSRLGAEIALRMKITILSHNAELFHWIMYQIDADERRSAVHPEDRKLLVMSAVLLATDRQDLHDLHHHGLGGHVVELLMKADRQERLYGANVLKALQSLWKRAKRVAVLKVSKPRTSTLDSALNEGGAVTAAITNLGPDTLHIVQLRDSSEQLLQHIKPLCAWEYLIELFKAKYRTSNKSLAEAPSKDNVAENELDIVLTRGRAEIAASVFSEVVTTLSGEITAETQLSAFALDHFELMLFACKAIPEPAFDALKHFLSIAVPKRTIPRAIELLSATDLDHPTDDLTIVWTEELLSSIDIVLEDEPLPEMVAAGVFQVAFMGAVGGKKASKAPARRKSVERIW